MMHFICCHREQNVDVRNERHIYEREKTNERLTKSQVGQGGSIRHLEVRDCCSLRGILHMNRTAWGKGCKEAVILEF